jgi:hypothetical protein
MVRTFVTRMASEGGVLSKQPSTPPSTPLVPPEQRAGTYESEHDVTGLLWYGTHTILDLPRDRERTAIGAARDRDIVLRGDGISAHHAVLTRRARGLVVADDGSKNGIACEVERDFGLALKPTFEDRRVAEPFTLVPGRTFVLGADPNRLIALDDAMREAHPQLIEILGREDEVRTATEGGETPSPSDVILAADGTGHILITGKPGSEQQTLAVLIHRMSKRRGQVLHKIDGVPDDRRSQSAILKKAVKSTLVLDLGANRKRIDPSFVSGLFSASFQIRAIVLARTANQARRALGHQYWRAMNHIALCPMAQRRAAIPRLLDQWLAHHGSALRFADLTVQNQRALLHNAWRENLVSLREAAVRLAAIVREGFSRKRAAEALGVARQTFYHWFNNTMKLTKPLVAGRTPPALADPRSGE